MVCSQSYFPFSFLDYRQSDGFTGSFMTHKGALASNILAVCCWQVVAFLLYRKKIFVVV